MTWRHATIALLVVVVLALCIYDVLAVSVGGRGSTISEVFLSAAQQDPVLAFVLGFLCCHLVGWTQRAR